MIRWKHIRYKHNRVFFSLQALPVWKTSLSGSISLMFKTNEPNGLLLFNGGGNPGKVKNHLKNLDQKHFTKANKIDLENYFFWFERIYCQFIVACATFKSRRINDVQWAQTCNRFDLNIIFSLTKHCYLF